jgi:YidC/Oxa1 family membrane protein insertase
MNWIYIGLSDVGITNLGLTIIIFALLMRLILFPITYLQQKKNKIMQYIQPELNKVEKKYRGKTDQDSMMKKSQEQQQVYKKYGTSATGGCLPMLIQFIILFGIIKIVYNIPNYITSIQDVYMNIAQPMVAAGKDVVGQMQSMATELRVTNYFKDYGSTTDVISLLSRFKDDSWETAKQIFASYPDVISNIDKYVPQIKELNDFAFGINISEYPKSHGFSAYLIIPVVAAFFQWLQTKTIRQPEMSEEMSGMNTYMKVMTNVMPLMSLIFYSILPCAIGLYWASTAFFTTLQQIGLNFYFDHKDMDKMIEKQVEKAKGKKKRTLYDRMMDASMNAANESGTTPNVPNGSYVNESKTIGNAAHINTKKIESVTVVPAKKEEVINGEDGNKQVKGKKGKKKQGELSSQPSIAQIANMLNDKVD